MFPFPSFFLCAPITKSLVSQGKSRIYKFVCWESLSGEPAAGCWIIAGGWIQSQHCRWYFQITNLYPPSTQHTGLPLIYFPVTPISLCYTSITQNRRNCSSERNIIGKYGSVTCRAICPGVLAWRDTRPRHWPTKFYGKRVPTLTARHSRVSGAKVSQHRMARLINDGAATSSSLQLASSILSRSAAKLFKEVASPYNGWSPDLQRLISRSTASPCWSVDLQWLISRSTLVGVHLGILPCTQGHIYLQAFEKTSSVRLLTMWSNGIVGLSSKWELYKKKLGTFA